MSNPLKIVLIISMSKIRKMCIFRWKCFVSEFLCITICLAFEWKMWIHHKVPCSHIPQADRQQDKLWSSRTEFILVPPGACGTVLSINASGKEEGKQVHFRWNMDSFLQFHPLNNNGIYWTKTLYSNTYPTMDIFPKGKIYIFTGSVTPISAFSSQNHKHLYF